MSDVIDYGIEPVGSFIGAMEVPHHGEIDLNEIMYSAVYGRTIHKISAEHPSKFWQNNLRTSGRKIYNFPKLWEVREPQIFQGSCSK